MEESKQRLAPRYGEQTDEILREAGYSDEDVVSLRNDGIVA